jgi:hypothetical protein
LETEIEWIVLEECGLVGPDRWLCNPSQATLSLQMEWVRIARFGENLISTVSVTHRKYIPSHFGKLTALCLVAQIFQEDTHD